MADIIDEVAAQKSSERRIGISVDEWNVWRLSDHMAQEDPSRPFRRAPAIAEDTADMTDALVVGSLLLTLLRHADRVRIACVAQLVNVIPLIRTVDGGPAWMQPTAYPFADVATSARGTVLRTALDGPRLDGPEAVRRSTRSSSRRPTIRDAGTLALFAINRATTTVRLEAELDDDDLAVTGHTVLHDVDPRATNTAARARAGRAAPGHRPRSLERSPTRRRAAPAFVVDGHPAIVHRARRRMSRRRPASRDLPPPPAGRFRPVWPRARSPPVRVSCWSLGLTIARLLAGGP